MLVAGDDGCDWHLPGVSRHVVGGDVSQGMDGDARKEMAMRTRQKWVGIIVVLAALLILSAGPGYARPGGHGGGGHGGSWHGGHGGGRHGGHGWGGHGGKWHGGKWHQGHRWAGPRVGIGIGLGPFWGPYWGPYWGSYAYPYVYPPVVTVPSTQVYVQPSAPAAAQPPPPSYWYYCDTSQAYYPYVQQCPGGWRPVTPTPP
jgi:hypothetical protein